MSASTSSCGAGSGEPSARRAGRPLRGGTGWCLQTTSPRTRRGRGTHASPTRRSIATCARRTTMPAGGSSAATAAPAPPDSDLVGHLGRLAGLGWCFADAADDDLVLFDRDLDRAMPGPVLGVDAVVDDRGIEPEPVALLAVVERALERPAGRACAATASAAAPAPTLGRVGGCFLGIGRCRRCRGLGGAWAAPRPRPRAAPPPPRARRRSPRRPRRAGRSRPRSRARRRSPPAGRRWRRGRSRA